MTGPAPLCVVLVEPAGPLNVGSVARLCANFAVHDLRLVAPRCDPNDPDAVRMAVHGRSVLTSARIYPTLLAAVEMDETGSTRIGKMVFNHPFFIPGVICISLCVIFGFLLAPVII